MQRLSVLAFSIAPLLCSSGCATGETVDGIPNANTLGSAGSGGIEEDTDTDGGDDGSVPETGHLWCTRADAAQYVDTTGQTGLPIAYSDGTPPEGCSCAPRETHEWLLPRLVGNQYVADGPSLPLDVQNLRNNIYQEAENSCMALTPGAAQQSNCNLGQIEGSALDIQPLPGFQHPGLYLGSRDGDEECLFTRSFGATAPECSFVNGSYGISLNGKVRTIPEKTLSRFLANPGCLLAESGRVESRAGVYQLSGVTRDSLLWQLGLRTGDQLQSVNGLPLSTIEDAFTAFDVLRDETTWHVIVRRGSRHMSLRYKVGG